MCRDLNQGIAMFNAFSSNIVRGQIKLSVIRKKEKSLILYTTNAFRKRHQLRGFKANAIQFNNRQTVRIADDCLNYHARLNTNYHALLIDVVVLFLYLFGREIYIVLLLLLYF